MASSWHRHIWEAGVPLANAWLEFALRARRAEYEAIPAFTDAFGRAASAVDPSAPLILNIVTAFNLANAPASARTQLKNDFRSELLDELFNNQLLATAYREAPTTSRSPVSISSDVFDAPDIDWENSRISFHGKTFGRVRITRPSAVRSDGATPSRIGRPGSKKAINTAIDALIKSNPDFCNLGRKSSADLIRKELNVASQNGRGLSETNLSKYIRTKCGLRPIR